MTDMNIPEWINPVPEGTVGHGPLPGNTQQRDVLSEEQMRQMRDQLLESFVSVVVQAVRGLFVPGPFGAAIEQLEEWSGGIAGEAVLFIETLTGLNINEGSEAFNTSLVQVFETLTGLDINGGPEAFLASITEVFETLTGLNIDEGQEAFLDSVTQALLTKDPEEFVGSLETVLVDGTSTFGTFLNELWKKLTGQELLPGQKKDVAAVATAAGILYDDATSALTLGRDIVSSGANIIKNPGFENVLFQQLGSMYTTAAKRSGNFSLQLVGTGALTASYSLLSDDDANPANVAVTAGDVYLAEVFVKAKSTNTQTSGGVGAIRMHFQPYSQSNVALEDSSIALTPSNALKNGPEPGGWTKMFGYITMPPGAKWLVIKLQLLPGVNLGETYYFDDVQVREVTLAKAGVDAASVAAGAAQTAEGKADTAQGSADKANLGIKDSAAKGASILFDGGFENTFAWEPMPPGAGNGSRSAEQKRSGSYSWKTATGAITRSVSLHVTSDRSLPQMPTSEGKKYYYEAWVYPHANNSHATGSVSLHSRVQLENGTATFPTAASVAPSTLTKGKWQKLSGYITMPDDAVSWYPYLRVDSAVPANDVFYWDDAYVTEVTIAKDATDLALEVISSGANLIKNPSFENIWFQQLGSLFTGLQKRTGSFSLMLTGNQSSTVSYSLLSDDTTQRFLNVQGDDVLYAEVWVRGTTTNSQTSGGTNGIRMLFEPFNSSNQAIALTDNFIGLTASTALNNVAANGGWTKMFGYITMPVGTVKCKVSLQLTSAVKALDSYFFDDVVVREVTLGKKGVDEAALAQGAASTADGKAVIAQDDVNLRAKDFSNLVAGSDFEGTKQPWTLATGWSVATDQKNSGAKSLKRTANATGSYCTLPIVTSALPGEQFYIEFYARRDSTANGTAGGTKLRVGYNTSILLAGISFDPTSIPVNAWTKCFYTVTAPAGTTNLDFSLGADNTAGNVWVDDIVIRRVTKPDEVAALPQDKITGLPTDLGTAIEFAKSGANLITDPSFENATLDASRAALFVGGTWTHDTVRKRSGSRALKCVWGSGQPYILQVPSLRSTDKIATRSGAKYFVSQWVFADSTNSGTNTIGMFLECTDSQGVLPLVYEGYTQAVAENAWVKMETVLTVPAGYDRVRFYMCGVRTGAVAGDDFWFDDLEAYEVTEAVKAQEEAEAARDLSLEVISSGANLIKNPSFESIWFQQLGSLFTPLQKRTGSFSLMLTGNQSSTVSYALLSDNSATRFLNVQGDDVLYAEVWVRGTTTNSQTSGGTDGIRMLFEPFNSSNQAIALTDNFIGLTASTALNNVATNSGWTKMFGYITMPVGTVKCKVSLQLTSAVKALDSYFFDDVVVREVTLGKKGVDEAALAQGAAATAGGRAIAINQNLYGQDTPGTVIPEGKVENLPTVRTTANTAQSIANANIQSGSNLCANPGFENLSFYNSSLYSTEQKRSGTRSLRLAGTGSTNVDAWATIDNAGIVFVPASQGDVFYMEFWIMGRPAAVGPPAVAANVGGGTIQMFMSVYNKDNVGLTFPAINVTGTTALNGVWTKYSTYTPALPADTASMHVRFRLGTTVPATDVYYFDDVVVREVTEGSVAKANAGAADTKAQATVDKVVESVSGVVSSGNTPASVKTSLQDAWSKFWEGLTGNTGSNKLPSDVKAGATLVKTKSDDAFRDAGLADGKAVKAKNAAGISIASGSNLVANASFENFEIPVVGQWAYSTEQARTGTRSAKLTSNGSSNQAIILGTDGDGAELDVLCSPGDIFYVEAWIRGAGTNTATTGSFYISSRFRKKHPTTGVVTLEYLTGEALYPTTSLNNLKTGWAKISGYVTAPADSYGFNPLVIVGSNIAASNHWYVDDVTVREVTTAQATLDNIVQSVTGVTATGNSPVNAQNKLVDAWTEFWRGLNKDQTGTNKRPTDVNTAAAGLRDRANDAFNKGSDAEGKAIVGQGITKSYIESGSNVLPNAGFENTAFFGNELYSLEQKRTGLRSLKMTATGAIQDVTISTDSDSIVSIRGEGGEIYYYEYWMRGGSTVSAGQAGLHLRCVSDTGAVSFVTGYATITTANRNTWGTKYSGYLTLPPSTATFTVVMSVRANVPSGHVLYFDDVVVREVTSAAAINQNLYGQNTPGATIPEGKVEYLPTVRTTANTAQSVASALVASGGNLLANSSFESTSFSLAAVQGSYSTEQARTGTRSLKIISNASSAYGYVTSDLTGTLRIPASAGDIFYVEFYVRGADLNAQTTGGTNGIRLVINFRNAANGSAGSAVVNQLASSALDNVWTKVSGYTTASPAPAGTVGFYAYLELTGAVTSGETYYFDDVVIQRVTEGVAADTKAQATADNIVQSVAGGSSTGNSPATVQTQLVNAWTAFWQGLKKNTPESTETNKRPADVKTAAEVLKTLSDDAFRDAGEADGKAVLAQNNLNLKSQDFTNLLPGSDFESTTQLWPVSLAPATFSIITGVAGVETNTGTKSLRIVGGDTAQRSITFDSVSPNFEVKQGDQLYMELWVRESADYANTDTNDPRFRCIRGTGSVSPGTTIGDIKLLPANIPTANTWTKLSATVTIPAGVPAVQFVFTGPKTSPAMTGTLWVDDIVVRRVTKADEVVRLPATKVAGLPTIGSNICPNNSFEESTFWAGATMFSTEQARTGTRSLKMVANGANQDYWVINDGVSQISRITASPGDSFYIEFWVYGASHNTGTGTISMFITPYTNANVTLTSPGFNYTLSTANKGVWTKVSGTVTIPTSLTTAASISARVRLASNVPVNTSPTLPDTYYFDDFIIREVTVAQATADNIVQSVTGGTSTGNSAASVQTQLVNAWTEFWRGLAKDQTGTNKRPADVNVAAAGVLEIAEDGVRDADAAKGRAIAINQTLFGQDLPGTSIAETRIPTLSLQKIPTLTEDKLPTISQGKVNGLTTDLTGNSTKIQSTVDKIAGALTGSDTVDALVDDAAAALRKTYLTLSDHSRQIQTFITDKTSSSVKGAAFNVDFDSYANAEFSTTASPGSSSFYVVYSGAGSSKIGVQSGVAQWYSTTNANRDAKIIWQKSTNTDFQFLRGTMTTPPEQGSTGGTPKFHAIGRVSDDGNSFVWARAYCDGFLSFKGEMGYTLNGTEYVWVTDIPLTWALDMSFVCGVGTERRQYQVYSGTTLVKQWDERYANGVSGTLNETQSLCGGDWLLSKGAATAGAFTLTYDGVTTGTIAVTATATTVKNALVALGKGGTSEWFVRAHPSGTGWYISPPIAGRYVKPITFTVTTALTGGTLSIAEQAPRKWGAIAQIRSGTSGPKHSGKVGGTSVTDNETPARNGSIARMSRTTASSTLGFVGTNDTSLATFWDKIDYETSDIDANTATGTFTVKESKPYIITARVKIASTLLTNINLKLQVNSVTEQVGPAHYNTKGCGATWVQYLEAGQSVRLAISHDGGNAGNALAGGGTESYFSISGAG